MYEVLVPITFDGQGRRIGIMAHMQHMELYFSSDNRQVILILEVTCVVLLTIINIQTIYICMCSCVSTVLVNDARVSLQSTSAFYDPESKSC